MPPRLFQSPLEIMRQSDRQQRDEKPGFQPVSSSVVRGAGSVRVESLCPPVPGVWLHLEGWTGREGQTDRHSSLTGPFCRQFKSSKKSSNCPPRCSCRGICPDLAGEDILIGNKPVIFLTVQAVHGQRLSQHII